MVMPNGSFEWNPRVLRSLQYFESVARLGSVNLAAAELGVSASAVSHQMRSLASFVGEDLFVRSGRGLTLSARGQRLHAQVAEAFSDLASAVKDTVGGKKSHLRIAVCSSFGPYWLAGRLPEFLSRNPSVDIELRLYAQDPDQRESVADAIVTANPVSPGFEAVTLFEEILVPVGPPGEHLGQSVGAKRFITTDVPPAQLGDDWMDFWRNTDRPHDAVEPQHFLRCTHYILALAMAKAGLGNALVPDFVAASSIAKGEVSLLDPIRVASGRTYRFCYKVSRSTDPDIRALARWLKACCAEMQPVQAAVS